MKILKQRRHIYIVGVIFMAMAIMIIVIVFIAGFSKQDDENIHSHRLQWWLDEIGWDEDRGNLTGKGVTIAIIDTGIDMNHPDLTSVAFLEEIKVASQEDVKEDDRSHGTAVAGIIAGYPNADKGVLGVAPDVNILSIDISDGSAAKQEDLIEGIYIAIEKEVDIISISMGVKDDSEELYDAIQEAYEKGILIVAAAGNYMENEMLYPAEYDEVISVGAYDKQGRILSPKGSCDKQVIYLPGENIVTTSCDEDGYVGAEGTSFATAICTGVLALLKEQNADIDITDIYNYFSQIQQPNEFNVCDMLTNISNGFK